MDIGGNRYLIYRDTLGLSKREWGRMAKKAYKEFGPWLDVPVVARVAAIGIMDSAEQCGECIKFGNDLAAGRKFNKTTKQYETINISDEDKVKAIAATAEATKIQAEVYEKAVKMAEVAKESSGAGTAMKRKNLPPSLGIETTAPDGTVTRVVANSGQAQE